MGGSDGLRKLTRDSLQRCQPSPIPDGGQHGGCARRIDPHGACGSAITGGTHARHCTAAARGRRCDTAHVGCASGVGSYCARTWASSHLTITGTCSGSRPCDECAGFREKSAKSSQNPAHSSQCMEWHTGTSPLVGLRGGADRLAVQIDRDIDLGDAFVVDQRRGPAAARTPPLEASTMFHSLASHENPCVSARSRGVPVRTASTYSRSCTRVRSAIVSGCGATTSTPGSGRRFSDSAIQGASLPDTRWVWVLGVVSRRSARSADRR